MTSTTVRRRVAPAVLAGVAALVLSACGSDPDTSTSSDEPEGESSESEEPAEGDSSLSGTLNGAGASSQESAMQAWIAGFQTENPEVTVNYDPTGSGTGREQFTAGTVPFAGSDAALDDEEKAAAAEVCGPDGAIHLPNFIDPIAVIYNVEGVDLNLDATTVANIFTGTITTWDDPAIVALNPDATLPAENITVVHRSGDSGTTENLMEYLIATVPDAWPYEASGEWPSDITAESAGGTSELVGLVQSTPNAIGYASLSGVGDGQTAAIQVGEEFVAPTPEGAAAVVDASAQVEGASEFDHAIELARDTTESGAYPIVLVSYHLACMNYDDAAQGDLVKAFLSYIVSAEGQEASAAAAGSAPISDAARADAEAAIDAITVGG